MRAIFLLSVALAFFSQDVAASSREVRKLSATVEKQLQQMRNARELVKKNALGSPRDWRDRTKLDDIDQWAYTREIEGRVESLLREARESEDAPAKAALDEAAKLLGNAKSRAIEIAGYWQTPGISWRSNWQSFATANQLPTEPSDEKLLAAEQNVRQYLNAGDFVRATSASVQLDAALQAAFRNTTAQLMQVRGPETLKFIPRTTPCQRTEGTSAKATFANAAPPEDYYPPASKRRGEQGDIVVRAHLATDNCATEFAVVVSSGFPDLDQAALKVAEASTYLAATENGKPIEGYLTFKVRFTIKP